ncbi:hypothetical protein BH11MYX3_BH11MYX3_29320 [soil metagenome]
MFRISVVCLLALVSCTSGEDGADPPEGDVPERGPPLSIQLTVNAKQPRYARMRDAAAAHGMRNGFLLAGIANDETGLAMCWSEATWACQGPSSPDCGGGPVIAGSADGPCSARQGGLGMFQFDAGTYTDTINRYGTNVLTVAGQTSDAIDYAIWMVKISAYTTGAETDDKARAWINRFDPNNGALVDQWIRTVVRYYNGCQPSWSCWNDRYRTYSDGYHQAINEQGGFAFWTPGTRCGNTPGVIGEIERKYLALGSCTSVLGIPITSEQTTPDGIGRYSVFERGSIYWTPQLGAFEVHGRIRDAWATAGWETGALGYPTSDETDVPGGRRSTFQHGAITWTASTDQTSITLTNGTPP